MTDSPLAVFAGLRTPFCRAGTALAPFSAAELALVAFRELLARTRVEGKEIDEVILGCVGPEASESNPARVAALRAGVPRQVPAVTVSRNCASGFEAVTAAAERLAARRGTLFLVGGTESMSNYPLLLRRELAAVLDRVRRAKSIAGKARAASTARPRDLKPRISLVEGLTDPTCGKIMGETAEVLAREFGISRDEQDRYALESHRRAADARVAGRLAEEILPVFAPADGLGSPWAPVEHDNGIREGQTIEALQRLRPYFDRENGTVTVGNSSQVTDGACALLVGAEERGRALGLEILGRLRGYAYAGCDPERMGLGPVYAIPPALERAGVAFGDLGRIELNEAFAAQVIACARALDSREFAEREFDRGAPIGELDDERTNRNGGAIALGHPVGASGARLVLTLLLEMRRASAGLGLATLCVGGGQGGALVLERP